MSLLRGYFISLFVLVAGPVMAQQQAIDSLRVVLTRKLPDTTRANVTYDVANAFFKQSQLDSALMYLARMPRLCQRAYYLNGLGDYHRLMGVIRRQQGQYDASLTHMLTAINTYTKAGNTRSVAKMYHNLGLLYKQMGDSQHVAAYTHQGIGYMEQAIAINQRLRSMQELRGNYINLGILYEDLGQYRQGRDYFFRALAPTETDQVTLEDARILYNNLGKNYNVEKQYPQAIEYLEKSLAINLKINRHSSLAHNYRNLATSYIGLKDPAKAVEYAEKALSHVIKAKDAPLSSSVYNGLSRAYAAAGQYEKAYTAKLTHQQISDSLLSQSKTRIIAQLEGKYAVELAQIRANLELAKAQAVAQVEAQKASEIAAIQATEKRNLLQIRATAEVEKAWAVAQWQARYDTQRKQHLIADLGARNLQQTRQVQYMTGGLGLTLVLLSILIGQYLLIRRSNRQLSIKNDIITANSLQLSSQADQLRTLMKELHHRVKNNLAIVSGLLSLQASNIQDEKAAEAVRVGQQRVEAMSLIHQRLYQTDALTTINIREYLTDLAQSLMNAYGYSNKDFDLIIDAEEQPLDVEVAIPLGLIANELITNAFKYAYANRAHPRLRISLHTQDGLTLEVQDNGPGINQARWQQLGNWASFGKRLITLLSKQLNGQFELIQQDGALCRLHIPESRFSAA